MTGVAGRGRTNTFAPIPTNRASFEECVYYPAGTHPDKATLLSACFPVLRRRAAESGFALIEGLTAFCNPSNKINRDVYEEFRDTILAEVTAALPVDAVVMGLHGAAIAHGYDDVEGDLSAVAMCDSSALCAAPSSACRSHPPRARLVQRC